MLELAEKLPIRSFRLSAKYTASRLNAFPETRRWVADFEEASDKFASLEQEEAQLAVARTEAQAMVETADDAWDDAMSSFRSRLLHLAGNSVDAQLFRKYFADVPSHVTSLSFSAELMISEELEAQLVEDEHEVLRATADELRARRETLAASMRERTRIEVAEARFQNRALMAKVILNKLRRNLFAGLTELASSTGRPSSWVTRFLEVSHLASIDVAESEDGRGRSSIAEFGAVGSQLESSYASGLSALDSALP